MAITKKQERMIDQRIQRCIVGLQINVMDLSKVSKRARELIAGDAERVEPLCDSALAILLRNYVEHLNDRCPTSTIERKPRA